VKQQLHTAKRATARRGDQNQVDELTLSSTYPRHGMASHAKLYLSLRYVVNLYSTFVMLLATAVTMVVGYGVRKFLLHQYSYFHQAFISAQRHWYYFTFLGERPYDRYEWAEYAHEFLVVTTICLAVLALLRLSVVAYDSWVFDDPTVECQWYNVHPGLYEYLTSKRTSASIDMWAVQTVRYHARQYMAEHQFPRSVRQDQLWKITKLFSGPVAHERMVLASLN
jgi:hypothetical protein